MLLRLLVGLLVTVGLSGLALGVFAVLKPAPNQPPIIVTQAAPSPAAVKAQILVAAHPLRAGTLLTPDDLGTADLKGDAAPAGSYVDSLATRSALRGGMVRRSLAVDAPIIAGDVLTPGDHGFLAAVLGAGMRGVTIGVDPVSGTAGLIWPGDRVDLVLTQALDEKDQPLDRRMAGETVLTDVRVIAVDQQLMQGAQGSTANPANAQNRTVTLEASPYDAERIMVASRLGKLTLMVRSAAGAEPLKVGQGPPPSRPPIAWGGDVSPALRDRPMGKAGVAIRVYRGAKDPEEVKF